MLLNPSVELSGRMLQFFLNFRIFVVVHVFTVLFYTYLYVYVAILVNNKK